MIVLHPRDVAAQQPGALFNVALAEILGFAKFSHSLTNLHCSPIQSCKPVLDASSGREAAIGSFETTLSRVNPSGIATLASVQETVRRVPCLFA